MGYRDSLPAGGSNHEARERAHDHGHDDPWRGADRLSQLGLSAGWGRRRAIRQQPGGLITNRLALPAGIPRAHPYLRSRIHEDAVCGADPRPLG